MARAVGLLMPRKLELEVTSTSDEVSECVFWVNHNLVVDQAPKATWEGKIPSGPTPLTIEVTGGDSSPYHLKIAVDGAVVTDLDRTLEGGADVFKKLV